MNVSNDAAAMNSIEYFTKQLPVDLANMVVLRDELAIRQGALSAAQAAISDREVAGQELAKARADVDVMQATAKQALNEANSSLAAAKINEKEFNAREKAAAADFALRESAVAKREAVVETGAAALALQQAEADSRNATLNAQTAALQVRVKAFQDKVAALSA